MPTWFVVALPVIGFALGFWAGRVLRLRPLRPSEAQAFEPPDEVDLQALVHQGIRKIERAIDGAVEDSYRDRFGPLWPLYYKRLDPWVVLTLMLAVLGLTTHVLLLLATDVAVPIWEPVTAALAGATALLIYRLRQTDGFTKRSETLRRRSRV